MKIIWQTQSQLLHDSIINNKLADNANGGHAYDFQAFQAIRNVSDISIDSSAPRGKSENILTYWHRIAKHKAPADILVKDPFYLTFGKLQSESYEIGVIHHLEETLETRSIKYRWYFHRLRQRLKKLNCVVSVSKYWQNWLENHGCNCTKVIYNSFDLNEFSFAKEDIDDFKRRYHLNTGKPLLYIGNAQFEKGVKNVYEALGTDQFTLVMSGPKNEHLSLPIYHLFLNRREYLLLLSACDVVLTMSTMIEGWNRTAHEAMLCGTPVIGSGVGGMKELLEGGGQVVKVGCSGLSDTIMNVLRCQDQYGRSGYKYASQFNLDYFNNEWQTLIQEINLDLNKSMMPK